VAHNAALTAHLIPTSPALEHPTLHRFWEPYLSVRVRACPPQQEGSKEGLAEWTNAPE